MRTPQEVFKQALEKLGFANHKPSQMTNSDYWLCTTTAMTLYAEEACKEQKRIDADAATYIRIMGAISVNKSSILNAPLAVNTEKV